MDEAKGICECARGPVKFRLSLTKIDGELLDSMEMCQKCIKENAVIKALDALGIHQ